MKILLWVSFTLLIFIVYLSGSFACLGITFLGLVFSLIIKPGPMRNNYLRIMMLVLFSVIILNPSVRNSVIDYALLSIDSDNDYYKKIEEFKELDNVSDKSIVEGDVNVRRNFYYQSIEQGLDNIFFGSDGSKIGRHSAIFDRFGVLGLMGIVPYLLFIIASISFTIKYIKHDYLVYYYVGVIIAFIIFFTKALHGWEQWLSVFYILPVSINLLTPKSENQFIK